MKIDARELTAALLPATLFALLLAAAAALLAATMTANERTALWALVAPRVALVVMLWWVAALAAGVALRSAWLHFGAVPGRLAEAVQVLVNTDAPPRLDSGGSGGSRGSRGCRELAIAVNALVVQRNALRDGMAAQVATACRDVEQERNRLASLIAELQHSVVVCNLDGRILLFNNRARLQFRALAAGGHGSSSGSSSGDGAAAAAVAGFDAIALGRSIYAVLDRGLVIHALQAVQQRLQRGAAHPSAQFVTGTQSGQLLRVQMTPVRTAEASEVSQPSAVSAVSAASAASAGVPLNGFVLMLDNITRDLADATARDRLLYELTEAQRGSIGTLHAAVEALDQPALDSATRVQLGGVIRSEVAVLSKRLNEAAAQGRRALNTRWPLEDMLGADFVAAAARRIESHHGARVIATDVDAALWLKVDSYSLIQALLHLTGRLADEYGVRRVQLRLALAPADADGAVGVGGSAPDQAQLDLVWAVLAMSTETVTAWETEPMQSGDGSSALTVRDVMERHGGRIGFERARVHQEAGFRLLLPLAPEAAAVAAAAVTPPGSRPEFYDFDLFAHAADPDADPATRRALADRPLTEITYTVFDTETTGLRPSEGDEIIQIGATRIVAGKLQRQACFEQLVDPQRPLSAAGIAVHGIAPALLRGQPLIAAVLPAFHAYAQDTVLVAHNAAFDMRFLQLKEAATGVVFDQPVLDTLLLSAVVHPQQTSHRLEAIAERLGVAVLGRHTALGDAMVTAEVFARLLPLLRAQGIHTLGQALEASKQIWLARVGY